jgi:Fe-S-cluster containining protein
VAGAEGPGIPSLDLALLNGVRFECRPECGLCCYAEPRLRPAEKVRLLRIAPAAEIVAHGGEEFLAARHDGGACQFLVDRRCAVHAVRPAPCREFPLTVHVGRRIQATAVLSCPGVDLAFLGDGGRDRAGEIVGLDGEIASLKGRLGPGTARRQTEAIRRRARIAHRLAEERRWLEDEAVREILRHHPARPGPEEFPVESPPSVDDGLERLPLFFDHRPGPVAIADGIGGWHLLELRAGGGVERPLAVVPPPDRPPPVAPDGEVVLDGYLRYWLERDALFGIVQLAMTESDAGDVEEWVRAELRAIGAVVLARADVRRRARGEGRGPLTGDDVRDGIRATDQDLLDRPGWGDRL